MSDAPDTLGRKVVQVASIIILLILGVGFALVFLSEFVFWLLSLSTGSIWLSVFPVALVLVIAAFLPRVAPTLLGALVVLALFVSTFALLELGVLARYAVVVFSILAGGAIAHFKGGRAKAALGRYVAGLGAGALAAGLLFILCAFAIMSSL